MDLSLQKRLASRVLGVGIKRVRIDPEAVSKVSAAITREDIRALVKDGSFVVKPVRGVSRARARAIQEQKRKRRRVGHGSRKGKKTARNPKKRNWITIIRPIRRRLAELREKGVIDRRTYRRLYGKAGGGLFRSLRHLDRYLHDHGLLKE